MLTISALARREVHVQTQQAPRNSRDLFYLQGSRFITVLLGVAVGESYGGSRFSVSSVFRNRFAQATHDAARHDETG